jgi:hypothetical protein
MLNQQANLDASSTGLKIRAAWALNNLRKDKRALAVYFRISSASTLRAAQDAIRVVQQAQMKRKGQRKPFSWRTRFKGIAASSRELLETADSLRYPFHLWH